MGKVRHQLCYMLDMQLTICVDQMQMAEQSASS